MSLNRWLPVIVCATFSAAGAGENWPQWRGPHQNGVSSARGLPTTWSETENVVWKVPLPSWSGSTPIVWGDRIFLMSPSKPEASASSEAQLDRRNPDPGQEPRGGRGRRGGRGGRFGGRRNAGGPKLLLLCLSVSDGKTLWQREVDEGNEVHMKQNNSSPTPVTDGRHVWAVTGNGAVAAFDFAGNEKWKRNLQDDYGRFGQRFGYPSSPIFHDGKLIIEVIHGDRTDKPSYIVALDGLTGKVVWREERPTDAVSECPDAYTTPTIIETGGKKEIVISGADYVTGHDPSTGKELWRAAGLNPDKRGNYRIIASPIAVDGMVYAPTRKTPLIALKAGGRGDVTKSHFVWKWDGRAAPDVPTPACDGKRFYMVDDSGTVTCLDAKTGEVIWGPQRTATGTVSASPLLADGKLYVTNENGATTVLDDGGKLLATNEVDRGFTLSSLAVAGSRLLLRTATHLYCLGK